MQKSSLWKILSLFGVIYGVSVTDVKDVKAEVNRTWEVKIDKYKFRVELNKNRFCKVYLLNCMEQREECIEIKNRYFNEAIKNAQKEYYFTALMQDRLKNPIGMDLLLTFFKAPIVSGALATLADSVRSALMFSTPKIAGIFNTLKTTVKKEQIEYLVAHPKELALTVCASLEKEAAKFCMTHVNPAKMSEFELKKLRNLYGMYNPYMKWCQEWDENPKAYYFADLVDKVRNTKSEAIMQEALDEALRRMEVYPGSKLDIESEKRGSEAECDAVDSFLEWTNN